MDFYLRVSSRPHQSDAHDYVVQADTIEEAKTLLNGMRKLADATGVPVAHPAVRPITTQEYEDVLDFALKDEVTAGNDEKVQPRPESLRHDHLRPLSELGKGKGH